MHFTVLSLGVAALFNGAAAAPQFSGSTCSSPKQRMEWRDMTQSQRENYSAAVHCLKTKPSRIGLTTTLYDDFPYVHSKLDKSIHFVASFLPWHRYFVHVYEEALQECGYTGVAAYWDWTRDVANVPESSIWDPITGVGGNGDPEKVEYVSGWPRHCVTDGPWKDIRLEYLGGEPVEHCLSRSWNNGTSDPGNMLAFAYTPEAVENIQNLETYNIYRRKLESGPHGAVHSAVSGDMMPNTSPNDPLFFLHHGQIDRLWWIWQNKNPNARFTDFSGDKTQNEVPGQASLDDVLAMLGLAPDIKVKDAMTTENSMTCYGYK